MTMKNTVLTLAVVSLAAFATPAFAADDAKPAAAATGMTFGVVDMDKVMQTSDAGKDIAAQYDAKRKEFATDLNKEQDSLMKTQSELEKEKAAGPKDKDAFAAKVKAFEEKGQAWKQKAQNKKIVLELGVDNAEAKLRKQVAEVVAEEAKAKGYSAVFTQNNVMMSTPNLDMTADVLKEVNDKTKKIPIDWATAADVASGKKK